LRLLGHRRELAAIVPDIGDLTHERPQDHQAGPSAGLISAYPTLSRPASICFSEANDVFVAGLIAVTAFVSLVRAATEKLKPSCAAAIVTAAAWSVQFLKGLPLSDDEFAANDSHQRASDDPETAAT
jgi:hypothetical protein